MKEIITERKIDQIELDNLMGNEIVVYKGWMGKDTDNYKFLAKLGDGKYGFVSLNSSNTDATYVDTSWRDSAVKASKNRRLFMFEDINSLAKALMYGKIKGRK